MSKGLSGLRMLIFFKDSLTECKNKILSNKSSLKAKMEKKRLIEKHIEKLVNLNNFVCCEMYLSRPQPGSEQPVDFNTCAKIILTMNQPTEELIAALSAVEHNHQVQAFIVKLKDASKIMQNLFTSYVVANIPPSALFMQMNLNKIINEFKA
jgi:hypothetical protein